MRNWNALLVLKIVVVNDVPVGIVDVQAGVGLPDLQRTVDLVGQNGETSSVGVDPDGSDSADGGVVG
tara:strand:- start:175 stop:375 length:201 start_codon:yes stop_codon:yes gene_type:complete